MKKIIIFCAIILIITISYLTFKNNKLIERNIYENVSFYNDNYIKRYIEYNKKHPKKKPIQIVTEVNIGLDNKFYTNVKRITNANNIFVLVNKYNYLDKSYVPNNLVNIKKNVQLNESAADSFLLMKNHAEKEGYIINVVSGYRSFIYQQKLYNNYSLIDGIEKADTYSARSGYSEHQTGLAIDVNDNKLPYTDFEKTNEFKWMTVNAYKYGFILRYPKDKERITGYSYEPWHYRYVGEKISYYIHMNDITFDEYYIRFIEKKS